MVEQRTSEGGVAIEDGLDDEAQGDDRDVAGLANGAEPFGIAGLGISPANASTGGTPDGELHPNVGLILFYDADGRFRCSGTLVSPTVLLTAAHCTAGTLGKTLVTFESVMAEEPPSGFPVAADPSIGFTQAEIEEAGYLAGTAYAHPQYSNFTDLDSWNDVGVVVLDRPVTNIAPADIAGLDYLDAFAQPVLNQTLRSATGRRFANPSADRRSRSR